MDLLIIVLMGGGVVVWFSPVIHVMTLMMGLGFLFSIEVDKMLNGNLKLMSPPIQHPFREEEFYSLLFLVSVCVCVCLCGSPVI